VVVTTGCISKPSIGSIITFGGRQWRVLDVKDGKALIISEQIVEQGPYHTDEDSVTWENCSLRGYLNNVFYESYFSPKEKARILETRNVNSQNPWYGTKGCPDTIDKVFLLSIDEVLKYFGDSGDLKNRKGWKVDYGKSNLVTGETVYVEKPNGYYINDEFNQARVARDKWGEECWWWLRSPGFVPETVSDVANNGALNVLGGKMFTYIGGVRPAMVIKL